MDEAYRRPLRGDRAASVGSRIRRSKALVLAGAVLVAVVAACGSGSSDSKPFGPGGTTPGPNDDGLGSGNNVVAANLVIDPPNANLTASAAGGQTLAFTARVDGKGDPVAAEWSLDSAALGTIDERGVFTASGRAGGVTTVRARFGNSTGTATLTVNLSIAENTANATPAQQTQLTAGGAADPALKWLYPYDKTVFPRGLLPPTLELAQGVASELVYLHVKSAHFEYKGFLPGGNPLNLPITKKLWDALTLSAGAKDPVVVSVTTLAGGNVTGPVRTTWTIAQGSLKGSVYYNSYDTKLGGTEGGTGAVLRIRPGATAELFVGGDATNGCTVCHSVSSNGSTLVAARNAARGYYGYRFDVANPANVREQPDGLFNWGALYPDGTLMMTNGVLANTEQTIAGSWAPNVPGVSGVFAGDGSFPRRPSRLVDPTTGALVPTTGWDDIVQIAQMPSFSPDGRRIAFNRYDKDQGHTISVMDFDPATKTFSNLVDVITDTTKYLGWPTFTPDGKYVIVNRNSNRDYATWASAKADLAIVHIASKTVARLDRVNGYEGGQFVLPHGPGDENVNYMPTLLPQPVGGYYWLVFTSRRRLGNRIVADDQNNSLRKKLWVVALDIDENATAAKDVSHPPFYLEGQELAAGNARGFWSLDACKANGDTCEPGVDDCCNGFCRQSGKTESGAPRFACSAERSGCAQENERCDTPADCCDAAQGVQCVANRCRRPTPR
jgi:hypothetical protein